jgi:transcriptional regulator with XRE-family HTH domain
VTPGGAALRRWRELRDLSQEQLARAIGKTLGAVSQYESGRIRNPDREALQQADLVLQADGEILAAYGLSDGVDDDGDLPTRAQMAETVEYLMRVVQRQGDALVQLGVAPRAIAVRPRPSWPRSRSSSRPNAPSD